MATSSINNIESCKNFHQESLENHVGGKMSSKTSGATRYVFKIGHVKLTIIDTPGFGDSRGHKVD